MWRIKIHPLVIKEDFKEIPVQQQTTLLNTIQKKLSFDPLSYGQSLRGEFSGYWRLRIGDYRVVYKIVDEEIIVSVIKVGIRKDDRVYRELFFRLKKLRTA